MDEFTCELNSFGARFAVRIGYITPSYTLTGCQNNRLVDLYISEGANTRVLQEVSETV